MHEPSYSYLKELLSSRCCTHNLRSASMDLLNVPQTKTSDRTFGCAVPTFWNNISEFTKSADSLTFRNRLKTFLHDMLTLVFFASDSFTILDSQLQLVNYNTNTNFTQNANLNANVRHCGLVGSAPIRDGTGCELDSWQCQIYIPCSLSLRLLGSRQGSLGTYGLTQKLC